jgi:hypothetical protein
MITRLEAKNLAYPIYKQRFDEAVRNVSKQITISAENGLMATVVNVDPDLVPDIVSCLVAAGYKQYYQLDKNRLEINWAAE